VAPSREGERHGNTHRLRQLDHQPSDRNGLRIRRGAGCLQLHEIDRAADAATFDAEPDFVRLVASATLNYAEEKFA
jgi:hypothetical protein